jgi:hypothetical protein
MTVEIPIRNLYCLYAYAWDQFHFVHRVKTGQESGPDAAPFFAQILLSAAALIARIRRSMRSSRCCKGKSISRKRCDTAR